MNDSSRCSTISGTRCGMTRRAVLGSLLAVFLMMSHARGNARAGGRGGDSPVIDGDTYVGRTSDPEVFVAVVLGAPHVTAYVCDGVHLQVDGWFYGHLIDDIVDLAATDGARLVGVRSSSGIDGWVTLPDGRRVRFSAQAATGIAGLYRVYLRADGRIHGESSTGAVLDGEPLHARAMWEALPSPEVPADWQLLGLPSRQVFADGVTFTAQITLPDGHIVPVVVWTPSAAPGDGWVILLSEGEARGHGIALASGAWMDAHAGLTR